MIFGESESSDIVAILSAIEAYALSFDDDVTIDTDLYQVESVVREMRQGFPYEKGFEYASVFKKMAVFICYFISKKPLKAIRFSNTHYLEQSYQEHIIKNLDAEFVLRFMINLFKQKISIHKSNGTESIINRPLAITEHSYLDFVETLSSDSVAICPQRHVFLVALLIEQMVYKTNPECQYDSFICADTEYKEFVSGNRQKPEEDSQYVSVHPP